jgi:hypothetical protein
MIEIQNNTPFEIIQYEYDMLRDTTDFLTQPFLIQKSLVPLYIRNAIVESALLHARQLSDIFIEKKNRRDDDIFLHKIIPPRQIPQTEIAELQSIYGDSNSGLCFEINKYLAHATTFRSSSHDYSLLLNKLKPLLFSIIQKLAELGLVRV